MLGVRKKEGLQAFDRFMMLLYLTSRKDGWGWCCHHQNRWELFGNSGYDEGPLGLSESAGMMAIKLIFLTYRDDGLPSLRIMDGDNPNRNSKVRPGLDSQPIKVYRYKTLYYSIDSSWICQFTCKASHACPPVNPGGKPEKSTCS